MLFEHNVLLAAAGECYMFEKEIYGERTDTHTLVIMRYICRICW